MLHKYKIVQLQLYIAERTSFTSRWYAHGYSLRGLTFESLCNRFSISSYSTQYPRIMTCRAAAKEQGNKVKRPAGLEWRGRSAGEYKHRLRLNSDTLQIVRLLAELSGWPH